MNPFIILLILEEGIDVREEEYFVGAGVVEIFPMIEDYFTDHNPLSSSCRYACCPLPRYTSDQFICLEIRDYVNS